MDVECHRPAQFGTHQLRDQRDARRATHQQHAVQVVGGHPCRPQCPLQHGEGVGERRADHRFELDAGEPHVGVHVGQDHRDRHLGVARQRLLGSDTFVAQPTDRRLCHRIVGVEFAERPTDRGHDVTEHGLVEIDTAQPFDALWLADQLEAGGGGAQHRRVEGASAEVVHRHRLARLETLERRVVDSGGLGFGDVGDIAEVGPPDRLVEQVLLVLAPVGRMSDRDGRRRLALALGDTADDGLEQTGHQCVDAVRRAAEQDRRRVAHPPLELACETSRIGGTPSDGGIAREHCPVLSQVHDRGDGGAPRAELDDLETALPADRGGGVGGAEVDPERVGHARPP